MGRKKLPPDQRRDYIVMIRFRLGVKALIAHAVEQSGSKSVSDYIRGLVAEDVKKRMRQE
jgi:hypothetical protein